MTLPLNADIIGLLAASCLTLFVFSYVLGDNFLYRLAIAVLIGGGAGYILAVALWSVILPRVLLKVLVGRSADPVGWSFALIGAILGLLIIFKWFPRWSWVGNYSMAYLIGVGAGVAIGGAALGTLFTQSQAVTNSPLIAAREPNFLVDLMNLVSPLIMWFVTLAVFISFAFVTNSKRGLGSLYARAVRGISMAGRWFMALAFGAIFAGVYLASVSVLISRVQFIADALRQLGGLMGLSLF